MKLVPLNTNHDRFVVGTFMAQTGCARGTMLALIANGANIIVAENEERDEDGELVFSGWAGTFKGALIYSFVKQGLARFNLDPLLLAALEVKPNEEGEILAMFDGPALRFAARKYKWNLVYMEDSYAIGNG